MTDSLELQPHPTPANRVAESLAVSADLPRVGVDVPRTRALVLRSLRRLGAWLFRRGYRVRTHGMANVPRSGPVILAANHIGVLDGPLLVAMTQRLTFAMAKSELFSGAVGNLLEIIGQIPVDQNHLDTHALRRAVKVLREERAFAIFPEGGRDDGELRTIKGGVAYLAMVTGAPVVPVAILGSRLPGQTISALPPAGSEIHIVYGEPIAVPQVPWPRTQAHVAETTAHLRDRMLEHLAYAQESCGMRLPGAPAPLEASSLAA